MTNIKLDKLFSVSDNLISLGYNCFFKKFLKTKFKFNKETNFFDNIGTSMWSINELLLNDFEDFFSPTHYKQIKIKNNSNANFLSNTKYYIRFIHDLEIKKFDYNYDGKYFNDFVSRYSRRKDRLYNLLTNNNKAIFFRLEEENENRIIYPEYEDKNKISEFDNLLIFTEIIRNKFPNLIFSIIYVSRILDTKIYSSNNIIVINTGKYKVKEWRKLHYELEQIFLENYDIIETFLHPEMKS